MFLNSQKRFVPWLFLKTIKGTYQQKKTFVVKHKNYVCPHNSEKTSNLLSTTSANHSYLWNKLSAFSSTNRKLIEA